MHIKAIANEFDKDGIWISKLLEPFRTLLSFRIDDLVSPGWSPSPKIVGSLILANPGLRDLAFNIYNCDPVYKFEGPESGLIHRAIKNQLTTFYLELDYIYRENLCTFMQIFSDTANNAPSSTKLRSLTIRACGVYKHVQQDLIGEAHDIELKPGDAWQGHLWSFPNLTKLNLQAAAYPTVFMGLFETESFRDVTDLTLSCLNYREPLIEVRLQKNQLNAVVPS